MEQGPRSSADSGVLPADVLNRDCPSRTVLRHLTDRWTPMIVTVLADGRRAFFKGAGPDDTEFARAAFAREERAYRDLGPLLAPWAPAVYGAVRDGAWSALLLEDLGPASTPPWSPTLGRNVAAAYADFHRATTDVPLPAWVPQPEKYVGPFAAMWGRLAREGALPRVAALAGDRAGEALRWLETAQPALAQAGEVLVRIPPPHALLHGDTRSDNLRWRDGRLRLFDWPHVGSGPAEFDLAAFAESVTVEGGPEPERFVAWYAARAPVRADALDASVSAIAAFFANGAWQPDIPGLPRLRPFQRAQLRVTLAWAARRLALPPPTWLDAIET